MSRTRAIVAVFTTAVLFATGGAAIKAASLSGWQIAGLRSLVAFVVLFVFVPDVRRRWVPAVWWLGLPYAAVMLLFVHANTFASAASVTLLQASAPVYVLLLAPWLLRERFAWRTLWLVPPFVGGLVLLLSDQEHVSRVATAPTFGHWLAAAAGLSYGLTILGLSALQKGGLSWSEGAGARAAAIQTVAWGNLLAAMVAAPFVVAHWQPLDGRDVMVVSYLGGIQIGLAYVVLLPALRVLRTAEVSLLLLVELIASPIFAAVLHGETLGLRTVLGGSAIVVGCILESFVGEVRR